MHGFPLLLAGQSHKPSKTTASKDCCDSLYFYALHINEMRIHAGQTKLICIPRFKWFGRRLPLELDKSRTFETSESIAGSNNFHHTKLIGNRDNISRLTIIVLRYNLNSDYSKNGYHPITNVSTVESVYSNISRDRAKYVTICEVYYIRTPYIVTFVYYIRSPHIVTFSSSSLRI